MDGDGFHAMGLRYRVNARPLPTLRRTADLVFTRKRVAVFIDGCFWHSIDDGRGNSKPNYGQRSEGLVAAARPSARAMAPGVGRVVWLATHRRFAVTIPCFGQCLRRAAESLGRP